MLHPHSIASGPRLRNQPGRLACAVLVCVVCCGCLVIPIHHKKEMHGAAGLPPPAKLDLTFLTVGTTSRQEVLERLASIDTGVGDDRFFLGRWKENSWDIAWQVGLSHNGDTEQWEVRNLIVDFDEKSIIRQISYFPNRRMINMLSARLIADTNHVLDLAAPVTVPVTYLHDQKRRSEYGSLILSQDAFEFVVRGLQDARKYNFKTTPDNLTRITMDWLGPEPGTIGEVTQTIHFKRKTKVGSVMTIAVDLRGMATLIKYLLQERPRAVAGISHASDNTSPR